VPWNYDEEAVNVLSKFTKLKCSLMPYLFRAAMQAHEQGTPMLRAMLMEFPDDPTCAHLDLQYMLGDSLLVAPVFSHDGSVTYYVPQGRWTNLLTGKQVEGPGWKRETHDFMSLPLLARSNSVIPMGSHSDKPDYNYSDGVTLQIYQLDDGKSIRVEIPALNGKIETLFDIQRDGKNIHIKRQGSTKPWDVLIVDGGTFLQAGEQDNELNIQLA
jgi:alpha-D-xyloside xylohydrolase